MRDTKANGRQSGSYFSCIFASVGGEISFVGFLSLGPLISGFTLVLCCRSTRREKFRDEM